MGQATLNFLPEEKRQIVLKYPFVTLFLEDKISANTYLENLEQFKQELFKKGITEQEFNLLRGLVFEKSGVKPSRKELNWYYSTFNVNGKLIENIGVYHDPIALKEYGKELEAAIKRASVIVLEDAPTALGESAKEIIARTASFTERKHRVCFPSP